MNPFVKLAFEAAGLDKLAGALADALIGAGVGSLGMTGAAALQDQPLTPAALRGAGIGAVVGGGPSVVENLAAKSELLRPHAGTLGRFVPYMGIAPIIAAMPPKRKGKKGKK